jgi:hypothetical protein
MGDYLTRKALTTMTSKVKIIEAAFKEKEFDANFCLSIVI